MSQRKIIISPLLVRVLYYSMSAVVRSQFLAPGPRAWSAK
jgi:hypothetical protein